MIKTKYKITQKALEVFKKNYKVIKVNGLFVGFCHNSKLESLKRVEKNNVRTQLIVGEYSEHPGVSICRYGAKNPNKVHDGFTSCNIFGKTRDEKNGIVRGIPDKRVVWMATDEAKAFKDKAKNYVRYLPDHTYIDTNNPEMRAVIPKEKFDFGGNSRGEHALAKKLSELGVSVIEI